MTSTAITAVNSIDEFDRIIETSAAVLVDYYADWCGPCRAVAPNVERVADETAGWLRVVKVNVDSQQALAQRSQVGEIPALHFYRDGQKVGALTGYRTADAIKAEFANHGPESPADHFAPTAALREERAPSWPARMFGKLAPGGHKEMPPPRAASAGDPTTFRLVESEQELANALDRSFHENVIVFLHDPWCPISARAYRQMEQLGRELPTIDVSRQHQLSMEVERRTGVRHQSPQVIVLRDAIATWDASHWRVTTDRVLRALHEHAAVTSDNGD